MAKVPSFSELITAATSSAVHLETRDAYTPSDPQFLEWKSGKPRPVPASPAWYDLVRSHVARGVQFRRARIVSEPVSDFIRFEYEGTAGLNIAAGEQVRWLPRRLAPGLCVPLCDFWIFDDRFVRFHHFSGDGDIVEDEMVADLAVVRTCSAAFEAVWNRAIPHADYRPA
jgi:hypothetical protein